MNASQHVDHGFAGVAADVVGQGLGHRAVPDHQAVDVTRVMCEAGKVVAAICHGPQVLISAGVLQGRRATCYVGIRDDVKLAGADYVDEEVVVDGNLVTSRTPDDLPAFWRGVRQAMEA